MSQDGSRDWPKKWEIAGLADNPPLEKPNIETSFGFKVVESKAIPQDAIVMVDGKQIEGKITLSLDLAGRRASIVNQSDYVFDRGWVKSHHLKSWTTSKATSYQITQNVLLAMQGYRKAVYKNVDEDPCWLCREAVHTLGDVGERTAHVVALEVSETADSFKKLQVAVSFHYDDGTVRAGMVDQRFKLGTQARHKATQDMLLAEAEKLKPKPTGAVGRMGDQVPVENVIESVRAWRGAAITNQNGKLRLSAIHHDSVFGVEDEARCLANPFDLPNRVTGAYLGYVVNDEPVHGPVPDPHCKCGFYGVKDKKECDRSDVLLDVEFSGTVIHHAKGYRAGKQRVLQVIVPVCELCSLPAEYVMEYKRDASFDRDYRQPRFNRHRASKSTRRPIEYVSLCAPCADREIEPVLRERQVEEDNRNWRSLRSGRINDFDLLSLGSDNPYHPKFFWSLAELASDLGTEVKAALGPGPRTNGY